MSGIEGMGEFGSIARWTRGLPVGEGELLGPGDDCAVLRVGGRTLLVTSDASVEGVHFDLRWCSHEDVGWRAMAGAISDIAAMGGRPLYATVSIALPGGMEQAAAAALYDGLRGAAAAHDTAIIGGDTTRSPGAIFIDITVIGEAPGGHFLPRSGARPGDLLAVTGWPGRSAAALGGFLRAGGAAALAPEIAGAHLRPLARLAEGRWLAERAAAHALIDVSDGILQDARHLAERSSVGLSIDTAGVPEDESLARTCRDHDLDARACYWSGGEDYELLAAVDAAEFHALKAAFEAEFQRPLQRVGTFTERGGSFAVKGPALTREGFEHFAR